MVARVTLAEIDTVRLPLAEAVALYEESILPELRTAAGAAPILKREYTSADDVMSYDEVVAMLAKNKLRIEDVPAGDGELLR